MVEKFAIAGYCRISVDDELDRDNTSIENQKAIIADYVTRKFPGSTLTFYEDRDRSGYTFEQREGYQEMRPHLMERHYDILIVKDLSRFSRRNSRGLCELEDLRDAGVRIIAIGDSIDYPTYDDWTAIQFRFLINEMPVTDTSKKVRSVIKRRQADGKWICAVPYGYVITNTKTMAFEVEPSEAEVVKTVFQLYIDGWGYKKIANHLTEQHIPTPRMNEIARKEARGEETKRKAKPQWSIVTIQGILQNDFYIGTLRQAKYTRKKINGDDIKQEIDDHIVFENNHEAIIDYRTFRIAQDAMAKRTTGYYRGVKKYDNVYSGMMVCGDCGSPMFPMSRSDLKPAYRCGAYHQRGLKGCTSHYIRVDILDSMVKAYLQNVRDTSEDMIRKLQRSIKGEADVIKDNTEILTALENQLADVKEERKMLIRQKAREIMRHPEREESIEETYDELLAECDARIEGIENQMLLTHQKQSTVVQVNRVARLAVDLFEEILNKDALEKNDLELLIDRIFIYEDHIHIKLKTDIECILQSGVLPEMDQAANFECGIIDILQLQVVQSAVKRKDKVYDVNVISNGDPLEIFTDNGGEVVFKKYSPLGEMAAFATQYADVLYRACGQPVIICDRDHITASAGVAKKDLQSHRLSPSLEALIETRQTHVLDKEQTAVMPTEDTAHRVSVCAPILGAGDIGGAVCLLYGENGTKPSDGDVRLTQVAASFFGKQLES